MDDRRPGHAAERVGVQAGDRRPLRIGERQQVQRQVLVVHAGRSLTPPPGGRDDVGASTGCRPAAASASRRRRCRRRDRAPARRRAPSQAVAASASIDASSAASGSRDLLDDLLVDPAAVELVVVVQSQCCTRRRRSGPQSARRRSPGRPGHHSAVKPAVVIGGLFARECCSRSNRPRAIAPGDRRRAITLVPEFKHARNASWAPRCAPLLHPLLALLLGFQQLALAEMSPRSTLAITSLR